MPPAGWGLRPLHPGKVLYKQVPKNYDEISQPQYSGGAGGLVLPKYYYLKFSGLPFSIIYSAYAFSSAKSVDMTLSNARCATGSFLTPRPTP